MRGVAKMIQTANATRRHAPANAEFKMPSEQEQLYTTAHNALLLVEIWQIGRNIFEHSGNSWEACISSSEWSNHFTSVRLDQARQGRDCARHACFRDEGKKGQALPDGHC